MSTFVTRTLGRSGIAVSGLGMGCWAIGGPAWRDGRPIGWGDVDDAESVRAIHTALDLGVTLFDTADIYGAGHSERILGQALEGRRDQVVIATKFGQLFDEATRQAIGRDASPAHIRRACDASLRRLKTDYLDLYQFHIGDYDLAQAVEVRETLEELVAAGKIRAYGWSTDDPARARLFAEGPGCAAIQQRLNIFDGNPETLAVCEAANLGSLNRGPLAMGLLTGKFTADSTLPENDVRFGWDFKAGTQAERLQKLAALRDVLTQDGRTLAQAALGWLWARSGVTIPIPGFKTVGQVAENAAALRRGPLTVEQMQEVEQILGR
ncbi:MAG: aldo/keto reductase [Chloroflexi bacterium]|nr:aldo/keto reductase [Chloroflexota bacterium]